jgi:hypothetical protein
MGLLFFLIFLSFAQIGLHKILEYAGMSKANGWLTMGGLCGLYLLVGILIDSASSGGCLGNIGFGIAIMLSFWALLTQLGYLFFSTNKTTENTDENVVENNDIAAINNIKGGDFWL